MKKKEIISLRKHSLEKLSSEVIKTREEMARLKLETHSTTQKDTNSLQKKRKKIAVLLTLMNEIKLQPPKS